MARQLALNPNARLEKYDTFVMPKIKQDRPAYQVINDGFFDNKDKFRFAGSMLYFDDEPNFNLYPLNKLANDKMNAFLDKLNQFGLDASKKSKKQFTPYELKEWNDSEDVEVPEVEHVMGVPKFDDGKDNIR